MEKIVTSEEKVVKIGANHVCCQLISVVSQIFLQTSVQILKIFSLYTSWDYTGACYCVSVWARNPIIQTLNSILCKILYRVLLGTIQGVIRYYKRQFTIQLQGPGVLSKNREGGQPILKKMKRNDFFDKSWRGRGSQNLLSKIEVLLFV